MIPRKSSGGSILRLALLAVCVLSAGRAQEPYPPEAGHAGPVWFVDVAREAGLSMLNVTGGVDSKRYIIEPP